MAARVRINDEYKKNKHVEDANSVAELQKFAQEVENELKTTVVQAKEKQPGIYGEFDEHVLGFAQMAQFLMLYLFCVAELTMNSTTARLENVMFNEDAIISKPKSPSQRCKKWIQGDSE